MEYTKEHLAGFVKQLRRVIVKNSVADNWEEAVKEWQPIDLTYDPEVDSTCVCGHPNLFYLYTIKNMKNGKELFPIGSSCIQRFKRKELTSKIVSFEAVIAIYKAMMGWEPIEFTNKYFSRGLIDHIYERGGFKPNSFNYRNPSNDRDFMKSIFNKHYKYMISDSDWVRVDAIMKHCILPFIKKEGEKSLIALTDGEKVNLSKYIRKSYKMHKVKYVNPDYIAECNIAYSSKGKKEAKNDICDKIKWQNTKKEWKEVNKTTMKNTAFPDSVVEAKNNEPPKVEDKHPKIKLHVDEESELRYLGKSSYTHRGKKTTLEVYVSLKNR